MNVQFLAINVPLMLTPGGVCRQPRFVQPELEPVPFRQSPGLEEALVPAFVQDNHSRSLQGGGSGACIPSDSPILRASSCAARWGRSLTWL